jgi:hypothetical protein
MSYLAHKIMDYRTYNGKHTVIYLDNAWCNNKVNKYTNRGLYEPLFFIVACYFPQLQK